MRRVWVLGADGQLRPVPVELGVNDGTTTAVTGGALKEGDRIVTGAAPAAGATAAAAPTSSSPFVPQRPRRSGGQGGGGAR
jgi:HlyD family secretion protein